VGARLIVYAESKKWSWVGKLISRHEPHKESPVGFFLLILSFILIVILLKTPLFSLPWMVMYPYWSYGLSVLWMVVFVAWAVVFVLGPSSRNDIVIGGIALILVVLSILFLPFLRSLFEGYTTIIL
jgi:hypothetical protein